MRQAPDIAWFACEACGARYRWKGELAGRKVKCRCGMVMLYPVEAPDDELYELSPARNPVAAPASAPAAVSPAVHAPAPVARPLAYRSLGAAAGEEDVFPDRTIDLHLPLVLLAGGAAVHAAAGFIRAYGCCDPATVFLRTLRAVGIDLLISPLVMMAGLLIAARFRGINFGNGLVVLMKLAAIAIAPSAAGELVAPIAAVIPLFGWVAVLLIEFALYFALIGALFKLDESDTWYCVCVFFVLGVATYFALRALPWQL